ncbi:MAG: VWA domain-containing protein [Synergistaceae bacterium]|nr:VWA domain-containing protein [Synergistaceae bacterium]
MFKKMMTAALVVLVGAALFAAEASAEGERLVFRADGEYSVLAANSGPRKLVVRALVSPSGRARERAPLAVALVLDKSGSMMSDGKMENAKKGALEALRMLDPRDVAAIVVYDDNVSVPVSARPVGAGPEDPVFYRAISQIRAGGMTALYAGTAAGADQLRPFIGEGYIPRVVMLSDGMANVGPSSVEELAALGRRLSFRDDITVTTIGLGLDYNEDLMTVLAAESGGNAYFARHAGMLPEIFARDLGDAVSVTARRVRVKLRWGKGVRPLGIVGRRGETIGDSMEVSIGNLYGGEKYALFEIEIPEGAGGDLLRAAELEVEYLDAASGAPVKKTASLDVAFTEDREAAESSRRADISSQIELTRNAEVREAAIQLADSGKVKEAAALMLERARQLQAAAPGAGEAAPVLSKEAEYFQEYAEDLESAGSLSNTVRKQVMNDAYMQKTQQAPVNGWEEADQD